MPMENDCIAVYQRAPATRWDTKIAAFDIVALHRGD
jgi:hypothetical protein